jgi:hypothetical protein
MTAMQITQEQIGDMRLMSGRYFNRQDYLEAHPVAVICDLFAQTRGLDIGDTIKINVPSNQRITYINFTAIYAGYSPDTARWQDTFMEFYVFGDRTGEYLVHDLELEIIGTFRLLPEWAGSRNEHRGDMRLDNIIYIPDSFLHAGYMPADDYHSTENVRYLHDFDPFIPKYTAIDDYLWDFWYSFELADTRNESAFLLENRDKLAALGMSIVMFPSGAENFWMSAEPVLRASAINAVMFCVVLVFVLGLITYLFLLQRRKDLAILRALGSPANKASRGLCYALIIFELPAVLLGCIAGWLVALRVAVNTMKPLVEAGFDFNLDFNANLLIFQIAAVMTLMLCMTFAGGIITAKRPVVELLQGRSAGKAKKR